MKIGELRTKIVF